MCVGVLTSLRRPECEHLVGLVQLVEALGQNLHLVAAVWLQQTEPGAALVAVGVHDGPLLDPHQPDTHTHTEYQSMNSSSAHPPRSRGRWKIPDPPEVDEEVAGGGREVFGA